LVRGVLVAALVALTACSLGSPAPQASPSPSASAGETSGSTLSQDLTFVGKLPARWTSATASCGQADGKGSDSFSVKLTAADALGQQDILTIIVGSGYKGAGEYSVDTTTSLASAGSGSAVIAASTPQLVTNFIVLVDKASGTIDSTMGQGANQLDAVERVSGSWRCR
jgi:hypothetical protein